MPGHIPFLPGLAKTYTVGLLAICWSVWSARNRATFERKWINTPFEIVFTTCAFLKYCASLHKPEMMNMVKHGVEMPKVNASQMLLLCGPPVPGTGDRDDLLVACELFCLFGKATGLENNILKSEVDPIACH